MAILKSRNTLWVDYEELEKNCQVERSEAHELYNFKIIEYEEVTDYIFYDFSIMKKKSGIEEPQKNKVSKIEVKQVDNENKKSESAKMVETDPQKITRENLLKSSKLLYQYAEANASEFKTFVTLTFKDNIKDIDFANKKFDIWRTKFKLECKNLGYDMKYLGVTEFQKRGAVHYHLLLNIPIECPLFIPQENKDDCYDVKYWSYGFSSVFDLVHKTDEKFNVVKYIAKYFFKDIDNRLFGRKKILKSNNLKKPQITNKYFDDKQIDRMFNDICKIDDIIKMNVYDNMKIIRVYNHF